ncbi:MAG: DUF1059 domain-containing protein [Candidatus Thermoplasmatota archaeon]|jgi:predicted small metal-binding protein|nr:DUF1059 domain-containing protein [Candidatus Thermoplasmatota archaeon]
MAHFEFKCKDIGMDCGFETSGKTMEELMPKIAEHAKTAHNMAEIPQDVKDKVAKAIKKKMF